MIVKVNTIKVLISKVLIDLYIDHDQFLLLSNVLREYNEKKEEIQNPEHFVEYNMLKQWTRVVSVVSEILRADILVPEELNKTKVN